MATTIINLSSLDGNNGFRLDGVAANEQSGSSVSNAGDINGDGFDDVIVGAVGATHNGDRSGSSYVVFGKASGFDATLNLSSLDGNNGFRLDGVAYDFSGISVSDAGDVNGDGFDDLIVGAPGANIESGTTNYGATYVIFGKPAGFDATLDLYNLDGNNGFRLDGGNLRDDSGASVSSAGDINGDGFDDVIIGDPSPLFYGYYFGTSYVVFGKAGGFDATSHLSSLDGSNGFRMDGKGASDYLGLSVSSAGDVNGDGSDDFIIGGRPVSYVVFGRASGFDSSLDLSSLDGSNGFRLDEEALNYSRVSVSRAGDVNGDGFDDVIVGAQRADPNGSSYVVFGKASGFDATLDLSSLDGTNGFRLDGAEGDGVGRSVSNAGDVNGDGFADLIAGASSADVNGTNGAGSSYVVFGKASGFDATIDLSGLDSNSGFRLDGVAEFDESGRSVSSAGDVNGDGFDDLIVGAPFDDSSGDLSGSSYVVFGRSDFSSSDVIEGTSGDDILKGTPAADIFEAGDGNDTMIGRGGADVFHGDAGDDDIKVSDLNFGLVDGGTGRDVLNLAGSDLNLDLANFDDKISGIESICLFGRGDNTLTLTAEDVLNLSDTTNTLEVHGNAGDQIVGLSHGWTDGGVGLNGYFHTFTQGDAVLLVGMNVTTDFV